MNKNIAHKEIPSIIITPQVIYSDRKLTGNDKLVLSEILGLLKIDRRFCWASNTHFSDMFGLKNTAVSAMIKKMEKLGWIKCEFVKVCKLENCHLKNTGNHRHIFPGKTLSNILDSLSGIETATQTPPLSNTVDSPIQYIGEPIQKSIPPIYEINIENNNTNVLKDSNKVRVDHRNPEVQQAMDFLTKLLGHTPKPQEKNRFSLYRLIKAHGLKRVMSMIKYSYSVSLSDGMAPQVFSYVDLEYKWEKVVAYGLRSKKKMDDVVEWKEYIPKEVD